MNWSLTVVAGLAVAASLAAQNPTPAPVARDRVGERSQEMRVQIETGKHVKSHVRVSLRLKNGNKLGGVVKDGRLVERVDGLRFVDAHANEVGAGIRLWYSGGGRDYVFVPFADLADYQVLERLSQKQLEQFESEMQMAEDQREARLRDEAARQTEAAKAAAAAESAGGVANPAPGQEPAPVAPATKKRAGRKSKEELEAEAAAKDKVAAAEAEQTQKKAWYALLQEYPPAEGWSADKRDEIARRRVVVGANPSEKERRFVEVFAEWQKACAYFAAKTDGKPAGEQGATGQPATGGTTTEETSKKGRRKRS